MNTSSRVHPQTNKFSILFHDTHHGHQQKKVHFMMAGKIFACKFEIFCWKPTFLSEFFLCICEKSGNFYSHGKWKTFFLSFFFCALNSFSMLRFYFIHHLFMVTEFLHFFMICNAKRGKELFAKFILMLKNLFSLVWYAHDYMVLILYVEIYIWDYYKLCGWIK